MAEKWVNVRVWLILIKNTKPLKKRKTDVSVSAVTERKDWT